MESTPSSFRDGILISFEGIDGSGKSTLSQAVSEKLGLLTHRPVLLTREPGGTAVGQAIRSIVAHQRVELETGFLLFAADRAEHVGKVIRPALQAGSIVLSDRFTDSSLAYQGFGRGVDLAFIEMVNSRVTHGLRPDLVVYSKIDALTALERVIRRAEALTIFEQEKRAFYERVIQGYTTIFKDDPRVFVIDAHQSVEALVTLVVSELQDRFGYLFKGDHAGKMSDQVDVT